MIFFFHLSPFASTKAETHHSYPIISHHTVTLCLCIFLPHSPFRGRNKKNKKFNIFAPHVKRPLRLTLQRYPCSLRRAPCTRPYLHIIDINPMHFRTFFANILCNLPKFNSYVSPCSVPPTYHLPHLFSIFTPTAP